MPGAFRYPNQQLAGISHRVERLVFLLFRTSPHLPRLNVIATHQPPHILPAEVPMMESAASQRILVVEDDPDIAYMVRETLRDEGYDAESLVDGRALLATVNRLRPDLILLDVVMPFAMSATSWRNCASCRRRDTCL